MDSTPTLLIRDIRIFDGENEISENGNILISNGLIKQISPSSKSFKIPDESTTVISKPGHTLLPGLIDGHIHAWRETGCLTQSMNFGVTTVCDMHLEADYVDELRRRAREDVEASDFRTASQAATIEGGWPAIILTARDKDEATTTLLRSYPDLKTTSDIETYIQNRLQDADYIKLMHEDGKSLSVDPKIPTLSLQEQIVEEAHKHGFLALAHSLSLKGTIDILRTGVDGMMHTFCDGQPDREVIDAYLKNNAFCNPTLAAIGSMTNEGQQDQQKYARDSRIQHLLSAEVKSSFCACMAVARENCKVEYAYQSVRDLKAAGIDIIVGSDAHIPALGTAYGLTVHQEMGLLVRKCGFSPLEALRAATSIVARRLRLDEDRGRIREGMRADLVLVEGNPMVDIDCTLDLRGVWKRGVLCERYKGLIE